MEIRSSLTRYRRALRNRFCFAAVYLQCPSIPEESRLYSAILLKLCKKFRPTAPAQEKLVFVLDALSKIEIRILGVFD